MDPDLVVRGGTQAFLALAMGQVEPVEALDSGEIQIQGEQETWARCVEILGLSLTPNKKTKHQNNDVSKNL